MKTVTVPENTPTLAITWGRGTKYERTAIYVKIGNRIAHEDHDINGKALGWKFLERRDSAEFIDQLMPVLKFAEWAHETAKEDEKVPE